MTGYHGFVQSIIRRGADAYQVTLGIYPANAEGVPDAPGKNRAADQLLLYRADIAIDENRTILFPDRELSRCMDAYYESCDANHAQNAGQREKTVGEIAAGICSELSDLLLKQKTAGLI